MGEPLTSAGLFQTGSSPTRLHEVNGLSLRSEEADERNCGRILVFTVAQPKVDRASGDRERSATRQGAAAEKRHVGHIAPELRTPHQTFEQFIFTGDGEFLQRLGHARFKSLVVLEPLSARCKG